MSKIFTSEIQAINPITSKLCTWVGERVLAESEEEAQEILNKTGRGYMKVSGVHVEDMHCTKEDWKNIYENMD